MEKEITLKDLAIKLDKLDTKIDMVAISLSDKIDESIEDFAIQVAKGFEGVDNRFDRMDNRFDAVDKRFDAMDERFGVMDKRFDAVDKRFGILEERVGGVEEGVERLETRTENIEELVKITRRDVLNLGDKFVSRFEFDRLAVRVSDVEKKQKNN